MLADWIMFQALLTAFGAFAAEVRSSMKIFRLLCLLFVGGHFHFMTMMLTKERGIP